MRYAKIAVLVLVLAFVAGCVSKTEEIFSGCYTIQKGGPPLLKIKKDGAKYSLFLRGDHEWSKGVPLHPASDKELQLLLGKDAGKVRASLVAEKNTIGIFKITVGDTIAGKKVDSDYFALLVVGAGAVYRVACVD